MTEPSSVYIISPGDPGLTYLVSNRLFNFRVDLDHGDHIHVDLTVSLVRVSHDLGGGRCLPAICLPGFGACRFRLPLSENEYGLNDLIGFIQSEPFQSWALGALDDLAGNVEPQCFGMLSD